MYKAIIAIASLLIAFPAAAPLNNYRLAHYHLNGLQKVPLGRIRRSPQGELKFTGTRNDGTTSLRGDVSSTLLKSDKTTLDGNAYYQHNFGENIPKYETGAGLQFTNTNGLFGSVNYGRQPGSNTYDGSVGYRLTGDKTGEATISGTHTNGMTSLRGDISGTILKSGFTTLDGNAHYHRNFGQSPGYDLGAGLQFNHDRGAYGTINYNKMPESSSYGGSAGYKFTGGRSGINSFNTGIVYNREIGGVTPGHYVGGRLNITF